MDRAHKIATQTFDASLESFFIHRSMHIILNREKLIKNFLSVNKTWH